MALIRPRLTDFYGIPLSQEKVDFPIPFLDEDIPLYIDPFLLWKSPSLQDNALHNNLVKVINTIGRAHAKENQTRSIELLIEASECDEVGLGNSATRQGKRIGRKLAAEILDVFQTVPELSENGVHHIEELQLLNANLGKDRISDFTASFLKSFLVDYTIDQSTRLGIPIAQTKISIFDHKTLSFRSENVELPHNPENNTPLIFVPKRWLRYVPYIDFDDYYRNQVQDDGLTQGSHIQVLHYNRENYGLVRTYIEKKERDKQDAKNDPLFEQIPIRSVKRKVNRTLSLSTGKENRADIQYEDLMGQLLASMLYPQLDFAKEQSRTDSGVLIRDLIFYNNRSHKFLAQLYDDYACKQIVVELKNVEVVEREHINQLNRYLNEEFGRFGILFTRNKIPKRIERNLIDLWSGQRKCILVATDSDLELMREVYESKNRYPIDVIQKLYLEFSRLLPS